MIGGRPQGKRQRGRDPATGRYVPGNPGGTGGHAAGIAALAEHGGPPEVAAITHGLNLAGFYPCRRCILGERCDRYDREATCALEREYFDVRTRQLADLAHIDAELDMPLVVVAVWAEVRAARGRRWLALIGEFRADALAERRLEYQPAAAEVRLLQKEARDALAELGASPVARQKLGANPDGPDLGALVRAAKAQEAAAREATVDAEFEADDDDEEEAS